MSAKAKFAEPEVLQGHTVRRPAESSARAPASEIRNVGDEKVLRSAERLLKKRERLMKMLADA